MKVKMLLVVLISSVLLTCKNEPNVVPITSNNANPNATGSSSELGASSISNLNAPAANEFHTVIVNEVLPASKYVYLNVTDGDQKYWLATRSMEVKVGGTYYYKGGLLKTNFESKEYNRVFDKVYLVGNLVSSSHARTAKFDNIEGRANGINGDTKKGDIAISTEKVVQQKGSIKISELVDNPTKYEGKIVQLSGICTKINAGIMDRNWIHLKDGSKDDYDLVITSDAFVPEGSSLTIKALVVLNKDFGAGYKYDLILEQGLLVN